MFLIISRADYFLYLNLDKIPTRKPTPEPATEATNYKKSKLTLQQEFMNEIVAGKKRYK